MEKKEICTIHDVLNIRFSPNGEILYVTTANEHCHTLEIPVNEHHDFSMFYDGDGFCLEISIPAKNS